MVDDPEEQLESDASDGEADSDDEDAATRRLSKSQLEHAKQTETPPPGPPPK